jgi:hypothetical protein
MDEVRLSERADAQKKVVYVPSDFLNDKSLIPIPRCGKRVTLVATIALVLRHKIVSLSISQ